MQFYCKKQFIKAYKITYIENILATLSEENKEDFKTWAEEELTKDTSWTEFKANCEAKLESYKVTEEVVEESVSDEAAAEEVVKEDIAEEVVVTTDVAIGETYPIDIAAIGTLPAEEGAEEVADVEGKKSRTKGTGLVIKIAETKEITKPRRLTFADITNMSNGSSLTATVGDKEITLTRSEDGKTLTVTYNGKSVNMNLTSKFKMGNFTSEITTLIDDATVISA